MVVFKASPRDRVQQPFVEQTKSFLQLFTLVEEVLVEVFKASPKDRAQQRFVEQTTSFLQLLTVVVEVLVEVFKASPRDRAHQRFLEQKTSTFPFLTVVLEREVFTVFPRGQSSTASAVQQTVGVDHGGPQRFPRGQSSTASAFEQTFSQAPHRSLPQAPVHGRHDEWVCVVDVENDNEYYWNRWDNSTCLRLPRGVKHRWCLLPSGLYRDVVLGRSSGIFPLSDHIQFSSWPVWT